MAKKITSIYFDWKEQMGLKELRSILTPFGLKVYESPATTGTDMYGFLVSDQPLTKKEIIKYESDEIGMPEDEDE